jgi:hypothetical protein
VVWETNKSKEVAASNGKGKKVVFHIAEGAAGPLECEP